MFIHYVDMTLIHELELHEECHEFTGFSTYPNVANQNKTIQEKLEISWRPVTLFIILLTLWTIGSNIFKVLHQLAIAYGKLNIIFTVNITGYYLFYPEWVRFLNLP